LDHLYCRHVVRAALEIKYFDLHRFPPFKVPCRVVVDPPLSPANA
jgi:hypothetical protein